MDPVTWIMLISAILGAVQQQEQADATEASMQRAAALKENDRRRQQDEAFQAATQETNELARQAQADMALFDTIAGEYGGGNTVDRARTVQGIQTAERYATVASNARSGFSQLGFEGLMNVERTRTQLNGIQRPSLAGTALQIGSIYYGGQQRQAKGNIPANSTSRAPRDY